MPQPNPSRTASTYWVDAGTRWIGGSVETPCRPSTRCCIRSFASNTTSGATLNAAVVSPSGNQRAAKAGAAIGW